jgi:hypothetical protein
MKPLSIPRFDLVLGEPNGNQREEAQELEYQGGNL